MKKENIIAFDIETGPLPLENIKHLMPSFKAPSNWKDEDKIAKHIKEKKAEWYGKTALDGHTGQLLAWGSMFYNGEIRTIEQVTNYDEALLIESFWAFYVDSIKAGFSFAGSNAGGFDIPFLVQRSRKHKIEIPPTIQWAKYSEEAGVYDLQTWWNTFSRQNRDRVSLNTMARFFGHPGKNGDGADFHKVFNTNPEQALEYLVNDLEMTRLCINNLCPTSNPQTLHTPEFA